MIVCTHWCVCMYQGCRCERWKRKIIAHFHCYSYYHLYGWKERERENCTANFPEQRPPSTQLVSESWIVLTIQQLRFEMEIYSLKWVPVRVPFLSAVEFLWAQTPSIQLHPPSIIFLLLLLRSPFLCPLTSLLVQVFPGHRDILQDCLGSANIAAEKQSRNFPALFCLDI